MEYPRKKAVPIAVAALATGAALPLAGGAEAAGEGCVAPEVVGVSLSQARRALGSSGCGVEVRQLPAHGSFVTPAPADGRQLVARQSPRAGARSGTVTVWVKPLCSQPVLPGPHHPGVAQSRGPTELVAALYLAGGPLRRSPHCRRGVPAGGTLTVSTPAGKPLASRTVRGGRFAIFPLAPGGYVLDGTLSSSRRGGTPVDFPATAFTVGAHRTTRVNIVANVP